jgi:hypothetical protein
LIGGSQCVLTAVSRGKQSKSSFGNVLALTIVESEVRMKWIDPLERFVEAIALLWLFDLIFKKPSRSRRLSNI